MRRLGLPDCAASILSENSDHGGQSCFRAGSQPTTVGSRWPKALIRNRGTVGIVGGAQRWTLKGRWSERQLTKSHCKCEYDEQAIFCLVHA